ncbi:hypothetical protein ACA910_013722 [Epithemia clementina (nom. ined.)]
MPGWLPKKVGVATFSSAARSATSDPESRISGRNQPRGSSHRQDQQLDRQLVPIVGDNLSQTAASPSLPSHADLLAFHSHLREQVLQVPSIQAFQGQRPGLYSNTQPSSPSLAYSGHNVSQIRQNHTDAASLFQLAGLHHQGRQQQEGYFQRIGQYDTMRTDQEQSQDPLLLSRVELVRSILERTSEQHQSHTTSSGMSISRSIADGVMPSPQVHGLSVSQTRTSSVLESYPAAAIAALFLPSPLNTLGSYNSLAEMLRISCSSTYMTTAEGGRQENAALPSYGYFQLPGTQYTDSLSTGINLLQNETSPPTTSSIRTTVPVAASTTAPGIGSQGTTPAPFSLPAFPLNAQSLVGSSSIPGLGASTDLMIESSTGDLFAVSDAAGAAAATVSALEETVPQQSSGATQAKEGHTEERKQKKRKYDHESFPQKLHRLITNVERQGPVDIISFVDEGGFRVDKQQVFVDEIMGDYFRGNSWSSFRRQLFSYNFPIQKAGRNKGAFLNPQFIRGRPELSKLIEREGRYDRTKNRKKEAPT